MSVFFNSQSEIKDLISQAEPANCKGELSLGFKKFPFSFCGFSTTVKGHRFSHVPSVSEQIRFIVSMLDAQTQNEPVALKRSQERSTITIGDKTISLADAIKTLDSDLGAMIPLSDRLRESITHTHANISLPDARATLNTLFIPMLAQTQSLTTAYLMADNPPALELFHGWAATPERNITVHEPNAPSGSGAIGGQTVVAVFGHETKSPQGYLQMVTHIAPGLRNDATARVARGESPSKAVATHELQIGQSLLNSMDALNTLQSQVTTGQNAPGWEDSILASQDVEVINSVSAKVSQEVKNPEAQKDVWIGLMRELGSRRVASRESSSSPGL